MIARLWRWILAFIAYRSGVSAGRAQAQQEATTEVVNAQQRIAKATADAPTGADRAALSIIVQRPDF